MSILNIGGGTLQTALLGDLVPVGAPVTNAVLSSAYTVAFPEGASAVVIQVYDQNVRVALGGATPTASVGFQIKPENGRVILSKASAPKLIQEAATATAYIQAVR